VSGFENMVGNIVDSIERKSITDVADTCYMAQEWFSSYGVDATAADLLKFAELVFERERRMRK
jgi:hypothetical protein